MHHYQPSQEEKNIYYILTENVPYGGKLFHAGSMCYLKEKTYLQHISGLPSHFWGFVMEEDSTMVTMDVESLQPVNERTADFLLAINNVQERLNHFLDRQVLDVAMKAEVGQKVLVELDCQTFPGTICYIGKLDKNHLFTGLLPIYFGVELQGDGEGKGYCAGTYDGIEYFKCKQKCGLFLPFNKLQFLSAPENDQVEQKAEEIVPVKMGDPVGFYLDEAFTRGIVMEVYKKGSNWMVKVCPEEEGSEDVFREIPIDAIVKEELLTPAFDTDVDSGLREYLGHRRKKSVEDLEGKPCSLGVNSVVRINLDQGITMTGDPDPPAARSNFPPPRGDLAVTVLRGRMRGIQGHCNSCYMDAALFSIFSCTSVLDSMLYKPPLPADGHIQETLRDKIVNPLRQKGFVAAKSMMDLRFQLTEKGESFSFVTSEKDPEEFLNLIMNRILGLEPLLKLQSGQLKEQECYCYQIFMDKQETLVVPNVQQLLEHSFISSDLKLVEIPSCFILQMPRFGKEYKMFSKIIPSLELDITDLLLESPRECFVCGDLATQECSACFKDKMFADTGLKQFCDSCCRQAHAHYQRKSHRTTKLCVPKEFCRDSPNEGVRVPREKLELFAVLCIETSHYVSFVKYGPEKEDWMFFDSMADRHGDENGYNIPTVMLCPEVAKYLEMPVATLAMEQPREMEGVAKRLFCDAYMYMYQSKKMALYK